MARYIREEDVIDAISNDKFVVFGPASKSNAIVYVKGFPGIEIVRCKDCKYFEQGNDGCNCNSIDGMIGPTENGFCSYGERRGEDGEVH